MFVNVMLCLCVIVITKKKKLIALLNVICFAYPMICIYIMPDCTIQVPLNNQKTIRQHSVSSEREDDSMEGLEEPLKAKKRRESSLGKKADLIIRN